MEKKVDTRRVVGCMTGTSIDGLDAALVEISGRGLAMTARVLATHSAELGELGPRLRAVAEQTPTTAGEISRLSREFSLLHARAIRELLKEDARPIDLVCVHGQTVFHAPPASWQLINAPVIAHELKTPVVFDLRAADVAAGGQGAPITPIADWILLRHLNTDPAIVNLGGFANYTSWMSENPNVLGEEYVIGLIRAGDICACNQLLDAVARERLGRPYDDGGAVASAGTVHDGVLRELTGLLGSQARSGRSLGTGDDTLHWIRSHGSVSAADLLRTTCEAIGGAITASLVSPRLVAVAGGGSRNASLVGAIRSHLTCPVTASDDLGVAASHREAICFAVLGALCQDRVPITLPGVTGVPDPAPISGCWATP